ncbi:MAG: outer membrane beta-barrel protein, partial [Bacteroidetes bacterium]|nr:outer membrane beta-barrel protein [Bacteroidota bacterium]
MKNFKKTILLFAFVSSSIFIGAQTGSSYGIKGGLNYNANGDYFESIGAVAKNPDRNIGFHIGVFGKLGSELYFRPELVYTNTKSDYNSSDFKMQKIDAPLLVGIKILGPVSIFAGPSFQYIIDSEFDGISINDIENDFSVGL